MPRCVLPPLKMGLRSRLLSTLLPLSHMVPFPSGTGPLRAFLSLDLGCPTHGFPNYASLYYRLQVTRCWGARAAAIIQRFQDAWGPLRRVRLQTFTWATVPHHYDEPRTRTLAPKNKAWYGGLRPETFSSMEYVDTLGPGDENVT